MRVWLMGILLILAGVVAVSVTNEITFLQPATNCKNYAYALWLRTAFSQPITQDFTLQLTPPIKIDPWKGKYVMVWYLQKNLQPKTTYTATLISNKPFLFKNKTCQSITWSFTTASKKAQQAHLRFEAFNPDGLSAEDPAFPFGDSPYDDHLKIDEPETPDKGRYDIVITLYAILNAGINGPPMAVQEAEYRRQLRLYKKEALSWLKQLGYDPASLRIKWLPEEAARISTGPPGPVFI